MFKTNITPWIYPLKTLIALVVLVLMLMPGIVLHGYMIRIYFDTSLKHELFSPEGLSMMAFFLLGTYSIHFMSGCGENKI